MFLHYVLLCFFLTLCDGRAFFNLLNDSARSIRPLPCRHKQSGEKGVCMFAWNCIKQNGTHLGTCMDGFYFGSCCQLTPAAPQTQTGATNPTSHHELTTEKATAAPSVGPASFVPEVTQSTTTGTAGDISLTTPSVVSSSTVETATDQQTTIKSTSLVSQITSTNSPSVDVSTSESSASLSSSTSYSSTTNSQLSSTENSTESTGNHSTPAEDNDKITEESISSTTNKGEDSVDTTMHLQGSTSTVVPTESSAAANISTTSESSPSSSESSSASSVDSTTTQTSVSEHELHSSTQNQASDTVSYTSTEATTTSYQTSTTTSSPDVTQSSKTTVITDATTTTSDQNTTLSTSQPPLNIDLPTMSQTVNVSDTSTVTNNSEAQAQVTEESVITETLSSTTNIPDSTVSNGSYPTPTDSATEHTSSQTSKPVSSTTMSVTLSTSTPASQKEPSKDPMSTQSTITETTKVTATTAVAELSSSTSSQMSVDEISESVVDETLGSSSLPSSSAETTLTSPSTASSMSTSSTPVNTEAETGSSTASSTSSSSTPVFTEINSSTLAPSVISSTSSSKPATSQTTTGNPSNGWVPITPSTSVDIVVDSTQTSFVPAEITAMSQVTDSLTTGSPQTPTPGQQNATAEPETTSSTQVTAEESIVVEQDTTKVCGRRFFPQKKIVGGSAADFGEWPWQVSLRQWRQLTYLHKCGAALMNHNWAITAAHCVAQVQPENLLLRIGEHELENIDEPYGYEERRVELIAVHPNFDARTFEYDLALLRFSEPVAFAPNIIPICLPEGNDDYLGRTAWVTGWGRLYENGPLPSTMQEVGVPVTTNEACESMYRKAGFVEHIPNIFLCAGWPEGGRDSCEGDSGGPLVLQRSSSEKHELIGVISWGIGCAQRNQPGVYTRITHFKEWIQQILQF